MEADIREIKRAKNFIWASAEDYELNPLYLAFSPDGKADTIFKYHNWVKL